MGRIIGIDLGTTNSVAAYWSRRRPKPIFNTRFHSPLTPSVVALEGNKRFVGQDAKDRRMIGNENVVYSIKRFIGRNYDDPNTQRALEKVNFAHRKSPNGEVEVNLGGRFYSPIEISAMILEQLKTDAEFELGEEVSHAVITVPAYFGQRQKNATREAGKLAGLLVLRMINEPTAAALSFGIDETSQDPQYILVYDLGGGTFDVSVLMVAQGNFEVLNIDGDNFLGGDDFDELILKDILERIERETGEDFSQDEVVLNKLKANAEEIKINLSREDEYRVVDPGISTTSKNIPVNLDYTLSRSDFENMILPSVNQSIEIILRALNKANLEVEEVDRVLLVGGSTRIPLIRQKLKEKFRDEIEIDVDPMQCVALGAAVQSVIPIEWMCPSCNVVNEGTEDKCSSCGYSNEDEESKIPIIVCEACGKNNRQGRTECWNCAEQIGAVIEFEDSDLEEEHGYIRIGDITSKYLGVEVLSQDPNKDARSIKIIIPKGTPYPTHDSCQHELYTNRTDQTLLRIPVYELENEDTPDDQWEHVGTVINNNIPSGTPLNTPVIVELRIDEDGILTVCSYIKRMKEDTFVEKAFKFDGENGGIGQVVDEDSEILFWLGFYSFMLHVMVEFEVIKKYLTPSQIDQALRLEAESKPIIDAKNEAVANALLERIKSFVGQLPPPIWDLFWAYWANDQPEITVAERRQTEQTIIKMENAGRLGDYDVANLHLNQLRVQIQFMLDKLPNDLLKAIRG